MRFIFSLILTFFTFASEARSIAYENLPGHFFKVSEAIYRGARPTSIESLDALAELGIKLDINLQGGDLTKTPFRPFALLQEPGERRGKITAEKNYVTKRGIEFVSAPLDCFNLFSRAENASIDLVIKRLEEATAEKPVYLHCEHGKDRTGLVIALYRVKHDHWSPSEAFQEWQRMGHSRLNQMMLHHLDDYFWAKSAELSLSGTK